MVMVIIPNKVVIRGVFKTLRNRQKSLDLETTPPGVARPAGVYPGYLNMKRLGVLLLPPG